MAAFTEEMEEENRLRELERVASKQIENQKGELQTNKNHQISNNEIASNSGMMNGKDSNEDKSANNSKILAEEPKLN